MGEHTYFQLVGGIVGKITVPGQPGGKRSKRLSQKNNLKSKKEWRRGSGGRATALATTRPRVQIQYHVPKSINKHQY
jgi:hypothetical protein